MRTAFLVVFLAGGCSAPMAMQPDDTDLPQQAAPVGRAALASSESIGQSVLGRSIDMTVFPGDADNTVLIIGGIHGSEPTSVDVAEAFAGLLRSQPSLARGRQVAIIPIANPDGYAKRTRGNSRGIDLNRNFEARNFRASARSRGTQPLSEPESRALAGAIQQLRPKLLISIHSIDDGRHCNNYDGPARGVAELMTRFNGYPAKESIGYPTPGSLGSWAGQDLQIPMITLELPRKASATKAWLDNRDALLAAVDYTPSLGK